MITELKPCPFCGGNILSVFWEIDMCRIRCKNCSTRGPWEFNEELAVEAWNRRAEDGSNI